MSGLAVDTIGCFSTQAGAGAFPQTLAAVPNDSLIIRGTVGESKARLMAASLQTNAAGLQWRIVSPLLHDNVTGLTFVPGENPTLFMVPSESYVELNEQDTITVQGASGAATTITAALTVYYDNLRGTDAHLFRWSDIQPDIKYLKSVQVALNAIAVGAWTDTAITTTENQLHANKSYAVLGYDVSQPLCAVGIKGVATGNLRMCGPGSGQSIDITDYFIQMSVKHNLPYIPVVQANDRFAIFVSALNGTAVGGAAASVSLIVAELKSAK